MLEVGVLGANGQVGCEVTLHLAADPGVRVVSLVRSDYGAVLLRRAGVPCVVVDYDDPRSLEPHLGRLAVVADLTYPAGPLPDLPGRVAATTAAVIGAMRPGARYLGFSSIMAWGMPADAPTVRQVRVARTSYARVKRLGEQAARRVGTARGVGVVNLRLGQVHGTLQSVTQAMVNEFTWHRVGVNGRPTDPTTTVFTSAVAAAIKRCGDPVFPPGTYTLVSAPQWTLAELHEFYSERYGVEPDVAYQTLPAGGLRAGVRRWAVGRAVAARGVLEAQVVMRSTRLFRLLKGRYRVARAGGGGESVCGVTRYHLLGRVPGPMVADIGSAPAEVLVADRELDRRLRAVVGGLG